MPAPKPRKMTAKEQIEILSAKITPGRFAKMRHAAANRTRRLTVVLEDIFQAHNAAAALRSCDAFGVQEVHFIENKYRLRISRNVDMGVSKWQDLIRHTSPTARYQKNGMPKDLETRPEEIANTRAALQGLKERGFRLAAAAVGAENSIGEIPTDKPVALLIGTELTGLSPAALEMADFEFSAPMAGFAQSLNLSVFAGICLDRLSDKMRREPSWYLSEAERDALLLNWLKISIADWQSFI